MPLPRKTKDRVTQVIQQTTTARALPVDGIVLRYDPTTNTAIVLASQANSDLPGGIHYNVPCPVQIGVQGVGPEPGRACKLEFKNSDGSLPIITSFFNYTYRKEDYGRQTFAAQPVPSFMLDM